MANDLDTLPAEDAVDLGPLSRSLGFLLRLGQLTAFAEFHAGLGDLGIRPGEFSVLLIVQRNPGIRQGVLAQRLLIKRAHMTKMMRALEAAGLVIRTTPADDRRAVAVALSPAGEALVARHIDAFLSYESRPKASLTAAEEARLMGLLRKYVGLTRGGAA